MRARVSLAIALSVAAQSCAHKPATPPASVSDPLGGSAAQIASEVAAPAPSASETLDWVLEVVKRGGGITREELEARFTPEFLQQVPADKAIEVFRQLGSELPPIAVRRQEDVPPGGVVALLDSKKGAMQVELALSEQAPFKIAGLMFKPMIMPASSYDEALSLLKRAGEKSSLLVAEVTDGRCQPAQQQLLASDLLAVGSGFKLWVLLALDTKLRAEKSGPGWDRPIVVKEALKSVPTGQPDELWDRAPGTEVSLRDAATNMIEISDNTATDHLIDYVGRERVEQAQRLARHKHPAANVPWLSTREFFTLKLSGTDDELAAYRGAPVAQKRKQLAALASKPLELAKSASWTVPRHLDLEWFASADDVCNVLATLGARARFDPESEVLRVLGENTGVPLVREDWKYIGYKGGSEIGVLNLSWLLQRADGKWFVVVITVNDSQKPVETQSVLSAAEGVLKLVHDQ